MPTGALPGSVPAYELPVTRLTPPPPPPDLVVRQGLLARLDPPVLPMLTVVVAPAGYGKTTLVASWVLEAQRATRNAQSEARTMPQGDGRNPGRVAWLTLEPTDDTVPSFWAALTAALHLRAGGLLAGLGPLHAAPAVTSPGQRLALLVNSLAALPEPVTLVLDDYQRMTNPEIHRELAGLVEQLPPTLHLVLITRTEPPLPLARLRARGRLRELREPELRFAEEEAYALMSAVAGPELPPAALEALIGRAGGWPAGLRLTALALRAHLAHTTDPSHTSGLLPAGDPFIFAYLVDEVVAAQTPAVQQFLLRTSILDALNPELCGLLCRVEQEAVAAVGNSAELLAEVERAQLFLTPLSPDRQWYRYHPLFAEALRGQLQQRSPVLIPVLHRVASEWFAAHEQVAPAVRHALAAGDMAFAADLLERAGGQMLATGQAPAWLGLLAGLPDAVLLARLQLLLFTAWALALTGSSERSERYLQLVERRLSGADEETRSELACQITMIRAQRAALAGDVGTATTLSRSALEQAPAGGELYTILASILGSTLLICGQVGEAVPLLMDASLALTELGDPVLGASATITLAQALEAHAELRRAEEIYHEVLARAVAAQPVLRVGARLGLSRIALDRHQLRAAKEYAIVAVHEAERHGLDELGLQGRLTLAAAEAAGGRPDPANLTTVDSRLAALASPAPRAYLATQRALLALVSGEFGAARHWLADATAQPHLAATLRDGVALAEATLALTAGASAGPQIVRLEQLCADAAAAGRRRTQAEALTLLALAQSRLGRTERAHVLLREALAICALEELVRPLLLPAQALRPLLDAALPRLADAPALQRFVSVLLRRAATQKQPVEPQLAEPLNPREREVLLLIAAGRSNREVAEALVIAEGTVKKHLHNLYGKLGVTSRTQALARARVLGLLSDNK